MYLDAFTISSLVDEFMDVLVGGRVQDVIDVDPTGFGLEIYAHRQRRYLYLSADQQMPRAHLVGDKLRRGLYKPTQLGLLFRRYIEGALLIHIRQPQWERIMFIDVEHPTMGESRIVVEPMERRANVLLLRDDGIILDCVHRIGPEENRYRLSLPNHQYKLPPPLEDRLSPFELRLSQINSLFANSDDEKGKAFRLLTRNILGFSPLLAREVIFRASGDVNQKVADVDSQAIYEAVQELMQALQKRAWQPGIAGAEMIEAYSVYPLTYLPNWRQVSSTSEAMTEYYGAAVGEEAYNQAKKPVQAAIEEGKIRFGAKLESMKNSLKDERELAHLQRSGELILAYQYNIEEGQTELKAQYDYDAPELVIKLDPDLTPVENAQKYFDKYNRAKRARENVPQLIEEAQHELDYILQLENDLQMATNWPEIDDVIQALQQKGLDVVENKKIKRIGGGGRSGPMKITKDGYIIWIGRNSRQNEQVTFRTANSDDLWLHARGVPGAHVVIRNDGRRIPESLIETAASIAAYYSAKRNDTKADVDVTRCKYVRPIKSAGPGMVTYRNEDTLTVRPANEEVLQND